MTLSDILSPAMTKMKLFLNRLWEEAGAYPEIFKEGGRIGGGAHYVDHHGWPTKKKWSKKLKITLETKVFGETFLSVFSNFLHFYI